MRDKYKKLTKKRKKIPKKITCNKKHKKKIDRKQKKTKRRARGLISRLNLNTRRAKIFPTNSPTMRNSSPTRRSHIKKSDTIMKKTLLAINRLELPDDIKKEIAKKYKANLDTDASTIQNAFRKQQLKKYIKQEQQYNEIEYDPFHENTVLITKRASNILTKKDKNDSEWKTILAKIYLGLHENLYQGGPRAENYSKTDEYFIKIIKNLYGKDLSNNEKWLNDKKNDFLREELIYPYMDTINPVD